MIGNGNVALDVARMLTIDPDVLAGTEIAPAALSALRASRVREVVVVGRRGPAQAAFTFPELVGMASTTGVELVVEPDLLRGEAGTGPALEQLRRLRAPGEAEGPCVVLRFGSAPVRIVGSERVEGVEFAPDAVPAGLVLTSIGYRGVAVQGLPFDEHTGTVPNERGGVVDPATGAAIPGAFVAGWIKRGPSGFIGTNRSCAQETVRALVEDWGNGRLALGRPPNMQPCRRWPRPSAHLVSRRRSGSASCSTPHWS